MTPPPTFSGALMAWTARSKQSTMNLAMGMALPSASRAL